MPCLYIFFLHGARHGYVEDFFGAVMKFLAFHENHADLADRLARAVTNHATPVGSGTVARTKSLRMVKAWVGGDIAFRLLGVRP